MVFYTKILKGVFKMIFCDKWAEESFQEDLTSWFPLHKYYEEQGFKIRANTAIFIIEYKGYKFDVSLTRIPNNDLLYSYWVLTNSELGILKCKVFDEEAKNTTEEHYDYEKILYDFIDEKIRNLKK